MLILVLTGLGVAAIGVAALYYVRYQANMERSLNMVFLNIRVPKKDSKEDREVEGEQYSSQRDFKEIAGGVMSQFYQSLYSLYSGRIERYYQAQDFLSFEYAVLDEQVNFLIVCPRGIVSVVEKQLTAFYPDAYVERVEDYNIFAPKCRVASAYILPSEPAWAPFKTYDQMNVDPINQIINSLSKLGPNCSAAVQVMLRPVENGWQKEGREHAKNIASGKKTGGGSKWWNPLSWFAFLFDLIWSGEKIMDPVAPDQPDRNTQVADEEVRAIDQKNTSVGYETVIRIVTSAPTKEKAKDNLGHIISSFAQYSFSRGNDFGFTRWHNEKWLIHNFILRSFRLGFFQRFFAPKMILSCQEIASIYHLPNVRFNRYPSINWQNYKIAPPPPNIPKEGILLGHNYYRGDKVDIRMKREDRFRHFYVIGQTGTGKSSILQVMIRQDLENGDGICVVDPHGSLIESILPFVPKSRADDVIYFDPSDLERPLGLNLLEAVTEEEKELVAMDAMNIMIKLFDEEVFGPRIQDYFRNGCLTLMSDPEGGALTDMVRLFTDEAFALTKRKHIKNPVVASFWDHQMANTGQREKQEMIPYFAAKFGQFTTNSMMRNIIGQAKSAFDFSDVMQKGKILLMNLSKGSVGEINSKLLGMIIVSKIQTAALRREKMSKEERRDFFLYIDEFQNYVTESIESILSEARKYRLSLNIAHQYLDQLEQGSPGKKGANLKGAVFGNVGTMMCYKIGAQDAEHMAKEMAPVFSDQDLVNVDKYKAVMKLSIDTQPSRPFSIVPANPYTVEGDKNAAEAYKQLSRLKYGRDRDFVDREILRRIGAV
ncbi:type IV secretion system DNA-binding domain-containing protein [Candidatus Gracilibacteria bacterium]|nr:type IV secretion system DNA-binding domain-containing protein [Candidatus Gracilibacteria bacterium]